MKRIVSYIIDTFVIAMLFNIASTFIPLEVSISSAKVGYVTFSYGYSASIFFAVAYFLFFALFNKSQTIGKFIMGITVCKVITGRRLTYGENMIRTLYKIISIILFPFAFALYIYNRDTIQDAFVGTRTIIT